MFLWHSKRVLEEYAVETNWASSQFQEIHANIHQAIESIVPASEYTAFVHQRRSVLAALVLYTSMICMFSYFSWNKTQAKR